MKTSRMFHKARLGLVLGTWCQLIRNSTYFFIFTDEVKIMVIFLLLFMILFWLLMFWLVVLFLVLLLLLPLLLPIIYTPPPDQ